MAFIRSVSGLRASLGSDLTPALVVKYVSALAKYAPDGEIVVGYDGRPSGKWIEMLASGVLAGLGRSVRMTHIAPTPSIQLIVEQYGAAAGIAITASHNPEEWNGLKFINSQGVFFDKRENEEFWEIVDNSDLSGINSGKSGTIINHTTILKEHVATVLALPIFKNISTVHKLFDRKFKVVADCVNSSGSVIIPLLLESLDIEYISLYCDSSGIFPHTPEPLPVNLSMLAKKVKEYNSLKKG